MSGESGDVVDCELPGPPHPTKPDTGAMKLPFTVRIDKPGNALLTIGGTKHRLKQGEYTDWIGVRFRAGWGVSIYGVCRFMLLGTNPEFDLYVTPINIDPEHPAMAIGYPAVYPIYLAKRQGPYATLGLAEDTWGLSEQVLEDEHFVKQCTDIDREREAMFVDGLEKVPKDCVFAYSTERIACSICSGDIWMKRIRLDRCRSRRHSVLRSKISTFAWINWWDAQ